MAKFFYKHMMGITVIDFSAFTLLTEVRAIVDVGFAHRFPGVYAFELVGGAHPTKNMRV
jgi:hypothetical protein